MAPGTVAPVVLFAYTPHRPSEAAFEAAVRQARLREARLIIVNAHHGQSHDDPQLASPQQLKGLLARARAAGVDAEIDQPMGPDIPTMLLNRAHGLPAEVLVLATRRRSNVGKLLMGSTAQRVIMEARCEVLLVKDG